MKIRSDFVTNSSSSSFIVSISLSNKDETETLEIFNLNETSTDDGVYGKVSLGYLEASESPDGGYDDYDEFDEFDDFEKINDSSYNQLKHLDNSVLQSIYKLFDMAEDNSKIRYLNDVDKALIRFLQDNEYKINDFCYVILETETSGYGEDYYNTDIEDIFPDLTVEDIDEDIKAAAKEYNTTEASLKVYRKHLLSQLADNKVTVIKKYDIDSRKIVDESIIIDSEFDY